MIARTIAELDPDVIAVQEVPVDTPEVIEAFLGDPYHLAAVLRGPRRGVLRPVGLRLGRRRTRPLLRQRSLEPAYPTNVDELGRADPEQRDEEQREPLGGLENLVPGAVAAPRASAQRMSQQS